jgi:hypothetical protein
MVCRVVRVQQRPLPAPGAVLRKNAELTGGSGGGPPAGGRAIGVAAPPPPPPRVRDGRDGLGEAD